MKAIERTSLINVPIGNKAGADVRLVVNTGCQSGCDFCHLEGNKNTKEIGILNPALSGWKNSTRKALPLIERIGGAVSGSDVSAAINICNRLNLRNIHLTGGEPTLNPRILDIISQIRESGLTVSLTTHGEYGPPKLKSLLDSGISGINFSMHAFTPEQYLAMDLVAQERAITNPQKALRYASIRLDMKKANVTSAMRYATEVDKSLKVNVNTVVRDEETTLRILYFANSIGVNLRLQCDLNQKLFSMKIINSVIDTLHAHPVAIDEAIKDSSGSGIHYVYPGGKFKVKKFGEIYIDEMCGDCPLKSTDLCRERFYGVRVQANRVTTCIDKDIPGVTNFTSEEFLDFEAPVPLRILATYLK